MLFPTVSLLFSAPVNSRWLVDKALAPRDGSDGTKWILPLPWSISGGLLSCGATFIMNVFFFFFKLWGKKTPKSWQIIAGITSSWRAPAEAALPGSLMHWSFSRDTAWCSEYCTSQSQSREENVLPNKTIHLWAKASHICLSMCPSLCVWFGGALCVFGFWSMQYLSWHTVNDTIH